MKNKIIIIVLTIISIGLIIGGFFCPPIGIIDGSVLTAVGEIGGFAVLFVVLQALDDKYDVKFKKGDTEITIGDVDEE